MASPTGLAYVPEREPEILRELLVHQPLDGEHNALSRHQRSDKTVRIDQPSTGSGRLESSPQRLLEQKILESRNGAAHAKLLDIKRKDEAQLLAERYRLDNTVCELLDMKDDVEREIAHERERIAGLRQECRQLEQREATLRHQLESHDGIVAILSEIGGQRATIAAEQLGWGEPLEDGGDVAA